MNQCLLAIALVAAVTLLSASPARSQPASASGAATSPPSVAPTPVPTTTQPISTSSSVPAFVASAPRPSDAAEPSTWELKDIALAAGVIVTLGLGVWNFRENRYHNKRTTFVNTVTSQRIKWIEQLRQDIGAYCGLTYHWSHSDMGGKPGEGEMLRELDRLRHVIRLRLNPVGEHDKTIEALIEEIPHYTDPRRQPELVDALERMTRATQALLKEEWDKVKRESEHGPLSERA